MLPFTASTTLLFPRPVSLPAPALYVPSLTCSSTNSPSPTPVVPPPLCPSYLQFLPLFPFRIYSSLQLFPSRTCRSLPRPPILFLLHVKFLPPFCSFLTLPFLHNYAYFSNPLSLSLSHFHFPHLPLVPLTSHPYLHHLTPPVSRLSISHIRSSRTLP